MDNLTLSSKEKEKSSSETNVTNKNIKKNIKKNKFFILRDVQDTFGKIGTIKELTTKQISNNDKIYSLWLYNNSKKNFYKFGYGFFLDDGLFLTVVLQYPLKDGGAKYNAISFKRLNTLNKENLKKISILLSLFESSNFIKLSKFIEKILNLEIGIEDIFKIMKIIKKVSNKGEKQVLNFYNNKLSKKEKEFLDKFNINKDNFYFVSVFFSNFFRMLVYLEIKDKRKIRELFITLLNVNVLIFDKIDFPVTNYLDDLDYVYFETP